MISIILSSSRDPFNLTALGLTRLASLDILLEDMFLFPVGIKVLPFEVFFLLVYLEFFKGVTV